MNEPIILDPVSRIRVSRNLLIFGLFISDIITDAKFDINLLHKVRRFGNIEVTPYWNEMDIIANMNNLKLCVLGNCFLATDEALDEVFGKKPKIFEETDLDSLRAIIYMLRCAIAHGTTAPRWIVQGQFNRIIRINEINYQLDARNIHGKLIEHKDFGRLEGALSLIDYASKLIDRQYEKSA